ncbi:MAG: hypothetical protein ACXVFN_08750 [Solirubrobacteraceae bacterium]
MISELVPLGEADTTWLQIMTEVLMRLREEAGHPLAGGYRSETRSLDWTPPGVEGHPGFAPVQRREDVCFVHHTDRERLVAHAASISFVGILEPARRAAVLSDLDARLRGAGVAAVDVPYRVSLWLTRRLA